MILPDGYSDVPAGKIAAVINASGNDRAPGAAPRSAQARGRYGTSMPPRSTGIAISIGRVGGPWLWVSRIRLADAELAATIRSPSMEIYALAHEGRDEGLLEMDFREPGQCEIVFFRTHRKTRRNRRRPLADEPRN